MLYFFLYIVLCNVRRENTLSTKIYDEIVEYILENQAQLYRLAYFYVSNKENALDIVQNSIVKALEHSESLKNSDAIKTWIYRIVINESITFLRKRKKELLYEPTEFSNEFSYEPQYEQNLTLYSEIKKLPENLQTIILLHFFKGFTLKEIANITNTNLNTIKSRLYKALDLLKIKIKEVH